MTSMNSTTITDIASLGKTNLTFSQSSSSTTSTSTPLSGVTSSNTGQVTDVWKTFSVTSARPTPTTSVFTTLIPIAGILSTSALPSRSLVLTHSDTVVSSASGSSISSNKTLSQSAFVGIFLVVGLVIASVLVGAFLFFRRRRKRNATTTPKRNQSPLSFIDSHPSLDPHSAATSMHPVEHEFHQDHQKMQTPFPDVAATSDWWDSADNGDFLNAQPRLRNSRSLDHLRQEFAWLSNGNENQPHTTNAPSLSPMYPMTLSSSTHRGPFARDDIPDLKNADMRTSTPASNIVRLPPARPPRSPLRQTPKRLTCRSLDSLSSAYSSSQTATSRLLGINRPPSVIRENWIEELSDVTAPLNVRKKTS